MLEEEHNGIKALFEEEYERGYREGLRLGMCISKVRMARTLSQKYDKEKIMRLLELEEDIYDELMIFLEKYNGLPSRKIAEHIVAESEYLIGIG